MCRADRLQLPPNIEISRHPRPRHEHTILLTPQPSRRALRTLPPPVAGYQAPWLSDAWLSGARYTPTTLVLGARYTPTMRLFGARYSSTAALITLSNCGGPPAKRGRIVPGAPQHAGELYLAPKNQVVGVYLAPENRVVGVYLAPDNRAVGVYLAPPNRGVSALRVNRCGGLRAPTPIRADDAARSPSTSRAPTVLRSSKMQKSGGLLKESLCRILVAMCLERAGLR